MLSDFALLTIGALLVTTIAGYLSGLLPYPFGIIVLSILFVARLFGPKLDK